MKTTALIDGDIFAYEAAASAEEPINWGDGLWTLHSFEEPAVAKLDARLAELKALTEADELIIALEPTIGAIKYCPLISPTVRESVSRCC